MKKTIPIKPFWYSDVIVLPNLVTIITTVNKEGIINAGPYSLFSPYDVMNNQPQIMVGMRKFSHTYKNILATGEFVINFSSADYLDDIMETSRFYPEGVNELENTRFIPSPSQQVKIPSIKECNQHIECRLHEAFFWRELADNYLEMCKLRLYDEDHPQRAGALHALQCVLLNTLKLLAPILPFVTEEIYRGWYGSMQADPKRSSIHVSPWPIPDPELEDPYACEFGLQLVQIASAVRRYKSEHNLALSVELAKLQIAPANARMGETAWRPVEWLAAIPDLRSVTRARQVEVAKISDSALIILPMDGAIQLAIQVDEG